MLNLAVFAYERQKPAQDPLGQYVPMIQVAEKRLGLPPHLAFAQATTRATRIAFVKKYGPIWGKVKRLGSTITVEQDLTDLEREQRVFQTAAMLVGKLRRTQNRNMEEIALLMLQLAVEHHVELPDPGHLEMFLDLEQKRGMPLFDVLEEGQVPESLPEWNESMDRFYEHLAHGTVCKLLDRFPPRLTFFDGRPAELPHHSPEGYSSHALLHVAQGLPGSRKSNFVVRQCKLQKAICTGTCWAAILLVEVLKVAKGQRLLAQTREEMPTGSATSDKLVFVWVSPSFGVRSLPAWFSFATRRL